MKQYTPMEAIKTGILPLMWFVLLCTAGINIFGIAMQVPFGKEMGFAGGIVALAMSLKAIINGTGRGVIGWISDRFGRRDTLIIVCVVLGLAQYAVYLSRAPSAACRCSCWRRWSPDSAAAPSSRCSRR